MVVFCTQTLLSSTPLSSSSLLFVLRLSLLLLNYLLSSFLFLLSLLVSSLDSLLCFLCSVFIIFFLTPYFSQSLYPPSLPPPSPISIFAPLISFLLLFCKFGQGDTTWLQLTPYRAGGIPFAHSQPAAFAVVESISTMLLLSRPLPLSLIVFAPAFFFFCTAPLSLSPTFPLCLYLAPLSSVFLSPHVSVGLPWAVAVGSTRASHTVT